MNFVLMLDEREISTEEVQAYLLNMKKRNNTSLEKFKIEKTKKQMFEVHLWINPFDLREIEDFIAGYTPNFEYVNP